MNLNENNVLDFVSRLFAALLFYTWGLVKLLVFPKATVQKYLALPAFLVSLAYLFLAIGDVLQIFPTVNLNQFVRFSLYTLVIFSIVLEFIEARRMSAYAELVRLSRYYSTRPDQPFDGVELMALFARLGYTRAGNGSDTGHHGTAGRGQSPVGTEVQSIGRGLQRGDYETPSGGGATRAPDARAEELPGTATREAGDRG